MTEPPDLLKSALAGRYAVGREVGRGGRAVVYLARDLRHERDAALKVLRPEMAVLLGEATGPGLCAGLASAP